METSPYEMPESDLGDHGEAKRSIWWKIYFFFITILGFSGMTTYLVDPMAGFTEYLCLVLMLVATVGLFAFAFSKVILNPRFWFIFFVIYIAFSILYPFISKVDLRMGLEDIEYYVSNAIGIVLSLPAYFGLYKLSKKSNALWKAL